MRLLLTRNAFEIQMMRLTSQFGDKAYSSERMSLIFREVSGLYDFQLKKLVDDLLMSSKFAPLPIDIRNGAAPYLDKNRNEEKQEESKVLSNMFTTEQLSHISKGLIQGLEGNLKSLKVISEGLKPLSKAMCKHCDDSGYIYAVRKEKPGSADIAFNCFCKASNNDHRFEKWGSRFNGTLINKNFRSLP